MVRKYTVDEIMGMREAVYALAMNSPVPMTPESIEAQLRTYMDNGTEPVELDEAAVRVHAA